MPSNTLLLLLKLAKSDIPKWDWKHLALELEAIYHSNMTLNEVLEVLIKSYTELLSESRYEIGDGGSAAKDLILAPLKGLYCLELLGVTNIQTNYTVEQFYNSFIAHMMGKMRIATVDWIAFKSNQSELLISHS